MSILRTSALLCALGGCGAPAPEIRDPAAPEPSAPPPPVGSKPLAKDGGPACVMLYECGCNARCVTVALSDGELRDGAQTKVIGGDLANEPVFVKKNESAGGVFTVQRGDPRAGVEVCRRARPSPLLGYLCSTKDSGPPRPCELCNP